MIETYTDSATNWAHSQEKNNDNNSNDNKNERNNGDHRTKTNSISPNYDINGTIDVSPSSPSSPSSYSVNNDTNTYEGLFFYIFNKSNIILFLWFLAIYFIAYYILGFYFNRNEDITNYQLRFSRTIDIIALLCFLVILISIYTSYTEDQKEKSFQDTVTKTKDFINEPISILYVILFMIAFYFIIYLFRLPMDSQTKPIVLSIIETISWILLIIIIISDFLKYVLTISFIDLLSYFFNWNNLPQYSPVGNISLKGNNSSIGITSNPSKLNEVFNVSNNLYTYDDAQAICKSYGADLADYDQIEDAYNHGAEWCNYGWSKGQMAFFPTQKSTWQNLQDSDHKNDCGRPGINGGYFANPYIKFGVNCYGKKPKPSKDDLDRMEVQNNVTYPKNVQDSELDKKVKFWKENADKLLLINSYNKKEWSEY